MLTSKSSAFLPLYILIFVLSHNCYAQVQQEWVRQYSTFPNGWNVPFSIVIDLHNNIYITGYSGSNNYGNHYSTVKYNSQGVVQWNRIDSLYYGTPCGNALDGVGNLYITGSCYATGGTDIVTLKYSPEGNLLWRVVFRGEGNNVDEAYDLKVDQSGNAYICGFNSPYANAPYRYLTLKFNSQGVLQWSKYYSGTGNGTNCANSLDIDRFGNSYVTGSTYNLGTFVDYTTIKYSSTGIQVWVRDFSGLQSSEDLARAITLDSSLNVYVTGFSGYSSPAYKCTTIKYDNAGTQQWVARFDSSWGVYPIKIVTDNASNIVILCGYGVIKYNPFGQLIWSKHEHPLYDICLDRNCDVYICGFQYIDTLVFLSTAKYSFTGNKLWEQIYLDRNYYNFQISIQLDSSKNVYVAGSTYETRSNSSPIDFTTIKYSQNIGIKPISTDIPGNFSLFQNYPNPFNPTTKIKFDIPSVGTGRDLSVQLAIYDLLGREVATLVNEQLKPGTYEVEWDGTNYPSGVYFYKLTTESFNQTKRMVLIK
jgi:hypothetical protein